MIVERTRSAVGANEEDDAVVVERSLSTFLGQTLGMLATDLVPAMRERNAVHRARVEQRVASLRRIAEELRRAAR